jgi:transcription-repair coupling factor (superfamily II helicase)
VSLPFPDLQSLVDAIGEGRGDLAIGGIVPPARALVLAAMQRHGWPGGRSLVVVANPSEARELAAGLDLLAPDLAVGVVPSEAASPYLGSEPPLAARIELVELLDRIGRNGVDLIVAPVRAMAAPIPLPEEVSALSIDLEVGHRVDTHELALRLSELGYRRVDLVEEAGEFALRGWIVDLHRGDETAIRIELDDDVIVRIEDFETASQRSLDSARTS